MRIGTLIQCLGHEQMLELIHALRANGIKTKQTVNIHELEVIEIEEVLDLRNGRLFTTDHISN